MRKNSLLDVVFDVKTVPDVVFTEKLHQRKPLIYKASEHFDVIDVVFSFFFSL